MSQADDAFGDRADEEAGDAGAAVGGDDDELDVLFLSVVGDAVGGFADQHGAADAGEVRGGEFFAKRFFGLLGAGSDIDDAPDFAGFERGEIDQNVDDVQMVGLIDEKTADLDGGERFRRKIDGDEDGAFGEIGHGRARGWCGEWKMVRRRNDQ